MLVIGEVYIQTAIKQEKLITMKPIIKYEINPRVKKRWFKENELVYDLIKHSEEGEYIYNGVDSDWINYAREIVVFSSKDIEQVITIKKNLEK